MARSKRGGGKVTPNLASDQEGTRALNLSVLRRLDPAVRDILITATHVVAYNFDEEHSEWSRKGVEGSLFIVKRNAQPRFQLIVMNRLNTENLVEDLLTDFEFDVQVPYLMYCNAADEIIGIWFYDPQECDEVAHLFKRIRYAYSRASPKAKYSSKSEFEELDIASSVPDDEDTLEQPTSPTIVPDNVKNDFLATFSRAAACVDDTDTIGGTSAVGPSQSFKTVPPPSHESHSASASQPSALQDLLPPRTSSVTMRPFEAHASHNSSTIQPASLLVKVNPALLAPIASAQTTMANTSSSLSLFPPLHPPHASHQPKSVPVHLPFVLPTASPSPPYGMPLLQPFPPPKPSPLLTPAACYSSVLTRDQVRDALLRLVQNDNFIDMVYLEMTKRPYP